MTFLYLDVGKKDEIRYKLYQLLCLISDKPIIRKVTLDHLSTPTFYQSSNSTWSGGKLVKQT